MFGAGRSSGISPTRSLLTTHQTFTKPNTNDTKTQPTIRNQDSRHRGGRHRHSNRSKWLGTAFSDGEDVTPTTALHTRKQPGTDQPVVATISAGEVGEIMNGPIDKDGYTWWGVHWLNRGVWGWSVERYLTPTNGGGGGSKPSVTFDQAASGNYGSANRTASDIRWIIIHTIQGSYEGGISVFNNPDSGVSAHYVIGNSAGQRTQMVYDDDISYAAGNYDYTVQASTSRTRGTHPRATPPNSIRTSPPS